MKLTRASDVITKHEGDIIDINHHVLILPKDCQSLPGYNFPNDFKPLNWAEFRKTILIGKVLNTAQLIISSKNKIITAYGESWKGPQEHFNHRFAGSVPAKTVLDTAYLVRLLKLPKKETKAPEWAFIYDASLKVYIPVLKFATFYWFQMPCRDAD